MDASIGWQNCTKIKRGNFRVNTLNKATIMPGHTSLISMVSSKATGFSLFRSCKLSEHSNITDLWQALQSKQGLVFLKYLKSKYPIIIAEICTAIVKYLFGSASCFLLKNTGFAAITFSFLSDFTDGNSRVNQRTHVDIWKQNTSFWWITWSLLSLSVKQSTHCVPSFL